MSRPILCKDIADDGCHNHENIQGENRRILDTQCQKSKEDHNEQIYKEKQALTLHDQVVEDDAIPGQILLLFRSNLGPVMHLRCS